MPEQNETAPGLREQIADAVQPLLMDTLPKPIAAARAQEVADVVLAVVQPVIDEAQQRAEQAEAMTAEVTETLRRANRELDAAATKWDDDLDKRTADLTTRAETAEATLARVREIAFRLAAHAKGFQDVLDDTDRDPWAKTVRADLDDLRTALTPPAPADQTRSAT